MAVLMCILSEDLNSTLLDNKKLKLSIDTQFGNVNNLTIPHNKVSRYVIRGLKIMTFSNYLIINSF